MACLGDRPGHRPAASGAWQGPGLGPGLAQAVAAGAPQESRGALPCLEGPQAQAAQRSPA